MITTTTTPRKSRTLNLLKKGIETYKYESNDYLIFTIWKRGSRWHLEVDSTFKQVFQGGDTEYLGCFEFDTLREAKLFATVYNVRRHA